MANGRWSIQELKILLDSNNLSDRELANRLPERTDGAVGAMRAAIHNYHI